MNPRKAAVALAAAVITAASLAACTHNNNSGAATDQQLVNSQLNTYNRVQPIPRFNYSQYRETLIKVEEAEANGVATTTFFYNMGSNKPVKSCPSIGYPIASTSQLTSPDQAQWGSGGGVPVGQMEPNGVFTGDSSGTYVTCVLADGERRIDYWEGWVETEGGPATVVNGQIADSGSSTVTVPQRHG